MSESPGHPTADELRSVALFSALTAAALEFLAQRLSVWEAQAGELVCRQGTTRADVNVLLKGEAEVIKTTDSGDAISVARLRAGDGIGVMSLVDIQPQHDTVRLVTDARLLRMTSADLDALYRHDLKAYSVFVLNLARDLSRRLRLAEDMIAARPSSRTPSH